MRLQALAKARLAYRVENDEETIDEASSYKKVIHILFARRKAHDPLELILKV